jgi:alpha-D-glucose phosphate-specific phosphoglucomutase
MSSAEQRRPSTLKAVVLAAGKASIHPDKPLVLEKLGDKSILQTVLANALDLVRPDDLYVIHNASDAIRELDPRLHYVEQNVPAGTGDAVLQAVKQIDGFQGTLLILYADTPLFRSASLRGMLNRHRLRNAHLTLLTADVDRQLPYGHIIRNSTGQIIDIIEDRAASPEVRAIREINVGAYAVEFPVIASALKHLSPSPVDGEYRLTDCVHELIRSGLRVESYRIHDPDEVQGINNERDLQQAQFILEKRLFHPRRQEEQNIVAFGTGGWRALIGEGFTLHNVRRLSQALCNGIIRRGEEHKGVIVGYDRRFLSREAAEASAEVFAGNDIPCILLPEDAPTPLINYATAIKGSAYGLAFTASHNPPEWNGLKVFNGDGSLLQDDITREIEKETNSLTPQQVVKLDLDIALASGIVEKHDFTNQYVDAIEALVDMPAIRNAGLRLIVDPMYGVGQLTLGTVLTEARCRVTFIHERHNPLFGGRSPAPNEDALRVLSSEMQEQHYDLGLAMDGDADRVAILDERGRYISINDILVLLYWYLHEVRGQRGGVVRNLSTTHMLDRLARQMSEQAYEKPVGFKHIASGMVDNDALLGGESSGGLTIRGHILGKDGIFACALIVEMLARTGQKISTLMNTLYERIGRLYFVEESLPATPEMRIAVPQRMKSASLAAIGPYKVLNTSFLDGIKLLLENDNWALLRFSGTEPVLRLTVEADSEAKARELLAWLRQFATAESH